MLGITCACSIQCGNSTLLDTAGGTENDPCAPCCAECPANSSCDPRRSIWRVLQAAVWWFGIDLYCLTTSKCGRLLQQSFNCCCRGLSKLSAVYTRRSGTSAHITASTLMARISQVNCVKLTHAQIRVAPHCHQNILTARQDALRVHSKVRSICSTAATKMTWSNARC